MNRFVPLPSHLPARRITTPVRRGITYTKYR